MDEKTIKKLLQKEIVPYLVGLRNEIADKQDNTALITIDGKDVLIARGNDGTTPVKDKDYPSEKTVFNFIKDNLPVKGKDYFNDTDIKDIVGQVMSLMPTKDDLMGEKGADAVIDYSIVKELATPLISAKYEKLKVYVDDITDNLIKAIADNKVPELSAEALRTKLESLKGNARLDAKAIKGLEKYMTTFISTSTGGGGGGSSTGGTTDHNALTNLTTGDVHTQYAFLGGRLGGQTLIGGTGTTDDLILRTTSGVGATGADMIFQGGNNGATEFGRFLNSGDFSVGSNAIYVNAASKFLGINTATHESYHLRIVTSSTQGLKMTRVSPFAGSEFRVDLSGSGAEIVATGSGGTSVIRGFVSGATQAYISAGHLAVGATAGSARIHSTWTGGAQFRAEYNSTNYWTLTEGFSGTTTYNTQGTTPVQKFALNGTDILTLTPGQAVISGSSPSLQLYDSLSGYSLFVSAGNAVGGNAGIYEVGTSSVIADYDYAGGIFNYAAGNLTYDTVGGIVYSYVPFNTPDLQAVAITASGNAVFNANVQVTGLVTGAGAPATILTNFNLYVDTVTGIVYVD